MKWAVMLIKHKMIVVEGKDYNSAVTKAIGVALDKSIPEEKDFWNEDWSVESVTFLAED